MFVLLASLVVGAEAVPAGWQTTGAPCTIYPSNGNMCYSWGCCNVPSLGGLSWCADSRKGFCTRGCQFFQCSKTCPSGYYCAGWERCQSIADRSLCISPQVPTKRPTADPTSNPTISPTLDPTISPTLDPTISPTLDPTTSPTAGPTAPSNPWNLMRDCQDLLRNSETFTEGVQRTIYPFNTGKPGDRYADFGVQVTCRLGKDGKARTLLAVKPEENFSYFDKDRLSQGYQCIPNPESWQLQAPWSEAGETKFSFYTLLVDRDTNTVSIATDDDAFLYKDEFSSTNANNKAPGTAGSCYSWNACESAKRGKFSVDLTGTGFALAESVKWKATGWGNGSPDSVGSYMRTDYKASGKCGAWCGSCKPESGIQLIADPKWHPSGMSPTVAPTSPWNPLRDCNDFLHSAAETVTDSWNVQRTVYPFNTGSATDKHANYGIQVNCRLAADGSAVTLVKVAAEDNFSYFEKDRLEQGYQCIQNPESWQLQADWKDAGRTEFNFYALVVDRKSNQVYLSSGKQAFLFKDEFKSTTANNKAPGTGGSCYSWANCASTKRGKFSVDLTGTGLALADSVKWKASGWGGPSPTTVSDYERTAYKASGRCGAWCGSCEPEGNLAVVPDPKKAGVLGGEVKIAEYQCTDSNCHDCTQLAIPPLDNGDNELSCGDWLKLLKQAVEAPSDLKFGKCVAIAGGYAKITCSDGKLSAGIAEELEAPMKFGDAFKGVFARVDRRRRAQILN